LIERALRDQPHLLDADALSSVVDKTAGYSGSDLMQLCKDAGMAPLRELVASGKDLRLILKVEVPPISAHHFEQALLRVRASVHPDELRGYEEWNARFGSGGESSSDISSGGSGSGGSGNLIQMHTKSQSTAVVDAAGSV
jgi:hypothetical protein